MKIDRNLGLLGEKHHFAQNYILTNEDRLRVEDIIESLAHRGETMDEIFGGIFESMAPILEAGDSTGSRSGAGNSLQRQDSELGVVPAYSSVGTIDTMDMYYHEVMKPELDKKLGAMSPTSRLKVELAIQQGGALEAI